jgi:hypothetical protein
MGAQDRTVDGEIPVKKLDRREMVRFLRDVASECHNLANMIEGERVPDTIEFLEGIDRVMHDLQRVDGQVAEHGLPEVK